MEFWVTIVGLLRRKRVIIPTLLVAVTLGVVAYAGTPNTYTSSTTMVLTTTPYGGTESQDPTKPTELTNPMLNFNESLKTTSAILIEAMNTKGVDEQAGATGATTLIINDGRTNPELLGLNGPFLYIMAQSTSPTEAKNVVVQAQKLMMAKLHAWQNDLNAPKTTYLSLAEVVPPTTPVPRHSMKLGLLAFLFGFLLCLGIAYLGHQLRARRRARAAARAAAAGGPPGLGPKPRVGPRPARGPRPASRGVLVPQAVEDEAEPVAASAPLVPPEPAVDPTPLRKHEPVAAPTPLRNHEPVAGPTPLRKHEPAPMYLKKPAPTVVRAPVKLKVRSRNR